MKQEFARSEFKFKGKEVDHGGKVTHIIAEITYNKVVFSMWTIEQIELERKMLEDNLIQESFEEFFTAVKRTMVGLDIDVLNQTIESLHRLSKDIIKVKSDRLKY